MLKSRYQSELDQQQSHRRFYERVCIALLAANMILGLIIYQSDTDDRVVIVPPMMDKQFWIKGDQFSAEYLELMSEWLAGLPLSTTPNSVGLRNEIFLRYVEPNVHAAIKSQFDVRADQVKKDNVSTLFYPTSFQTSRTTKQVAITGDFISVISGVTAPAVRRTWRLSFTSMGGALWVTEFIEVDSGKAFHKDSTTTVN
jgi:conjugal transfer pilus assembly protein TraE